MATAGASGGYTGVGGGAGAPPPPLVAAPCRTFRASDPTRAPLFSFASCAHARCARPGCAALICAEHGHGGAEESDDGVFTFDSRECADCGARFCAEHEPTCAPELDIFGAAEAPKPLACDVCGEHLCPAHRPTRCDRRFRADGEPLSEARALKERHQAARDARDADEGDDALGGYGLSGDFLGAEAAAKKRARVASDAARGIEHCARRCCRGCLDEHPCGEEMDGAY